jgi:hypothetical protein
MPQSATCSLAGRILHPAGLPKTHTMKVVILTLAAVLPVIIEGESINSLPPFLNRMWDKIKPATMYNIFQVAKFCAEFVSCVRNKSKTKGVEIIMQYFFIHENF